MIIRGFLTAMSSLDYATAREYLTRQAAQDWKPDSQVLIYASGATPRVTGNLVNMSAPLIGYLDADGSFHGSEETMWNHDFAMMVENGELRISSPPPGLALSQYVFSQTFMRIDTYFFPTSGTTLIPDPRYVQRGAWDRTTAARLVVDGPSTWLDPVADDQPQRGVAWGGEDVSLSAQGVADVPLSCPGGDPGVADATRLAVEVAATMRDMAGVSRVRLLCDTRLVILQGAAADGSLPIGVANTYDTIPIGSGKTLAVVQDGSVATMTGNDVTPVLGDWGATARTIHSLAMNSDGDQIAAVTDDGVLVGPITQDPPTTRLAAPGLLRPQFDLHDNVWVVSSDQGQVTVSMLSPDAVVSVDASQIEATDIQGFQVSPDGHRIALVRQVDAPDGPRTEVGVALITYDGDVPAAITAWKPIRLTWEGNLLKPVDVAWLGPSSLLVLGTTGVFLTDIDGLEMDEWGLPQAWTPVEMTTRTTSTSPQIVVLDDNGSVWSYQDGYWNHFGSRITSIAYPA